MGVCVQPVELPDGDRTWTVLGADHRQVGQVEEFLEYHRVTGSSPHTVRGYAKALQLWWQYLELDGRDWAGADVPALAGALLADADGVYDPNWYNDRLLLGLSAPARPASSTSRNVPARLP